MDDPGVDLRAVGDRIEALLAASATNGVAAHARAEELVRLVTDLYGAGLERLLSILHGAGKLDAPVLADIAADELVASLLLVHGLHPYGIATRVERALGSVRPALHAQGVDVELVAIDPDGAVRLRLTGAVNGCGLTTVRTMLESTVEAAAPDAAAVRVDTTGGPSLIPVSALRSRLTRTAG